jgi:hypothetical protein
MYIGGLVEDRLETPTTFSGATVSDFQTGVNGWQNDIEAFSLGAFVNVTLAAVRRFASGGSETTPKTYLDPPLVIPVTSLLVRNKIGSQRRRLGGF